MPALGLIFWNMAVPGRYIVTSIEHGVTQVLNLMCYRCSDCTLHPASRHSSFHTLHSSFPPCPPIWMMAIHGGAVMLRQ